MGAIKADEHLSTLPYGRQSISDADVEAVGSVGRLDGAHRVRHRAPQLGLLVAGQRLEIADLAVRHHQEVPADVRIAVEDGERHAARFAGLACQALNVRN